MSEQVTLQDLDECAKEKIHLSGAIRPSGCLLVIDADSQQIQFVSSNIAAILKGTTDELLGSKLGDHISNDFLARIELDITSLKPHRRVLQRYTWPQLTHARATMLWQVPGRNEIAFEVLLADDSIAEANDRVHRTVDWQALDSEKDMSRLMQMATEMIRKLTEYDRVMTYRFQEDGSGFVEAEAKREDLESYQGLYYPGSDVPEQARKLFIMNRVRVIDDVLYEPVPLLGLSAEATDLDLSMSLLRSVSPVHIQYLANMGVRSSLAISLVHQGKLWGMVACHHYSPKILQPALLTATELVSQLLSVLCERTERVEQAAIAENCQKKMLGVLDKIGADEVGIMPALKDNLDVIRNAVDADGAALFDMEGIESVGDTPDDDTLNALCAWLDETCEENAISTDRLGMIWPEAKSFQSLMPGMMGLRWSETRRSWLLWFRHESVRSVTWAGNPEKPLARDSHGRLTPRGSFEEWKSEIKGRAQDWSAGEVLAVQPLRRLATLDELNAAASEERSAQGRFLGSVHDPVIIVDLKGRIVEWNNAVEKNLGLEKAHGKQIDSLVKFASDAHLPELLTQAAAGQVWVGEYESEGDPPVSYEVALMPVAVEGQGIRTVAVALRDITERKILEEQLNQSQKMEALGQLTGGVAHNFNNLLTVMLGTADMIIDEVDDASPIWEDLQVLRSTCEDAANIVNDLMAFARQGRSEVKNVDVGNLTSQLVKLLQRTIRSEIQLKLNLPSEPLFVSADSGQLEQVIMNLIINARDAIEGTGQIKIRVATRQLSPKQARTFDLQEGTFVVIEVADSGKGVAAEDLIRIFDPFFTTKGETGGTGLGLSSSFGIIKKHGGHIAVSSSVGQGAVFAVYLPSSEPEEPPKPASSNPDSLKILLADDEPAMRRMMSRLITSWGHTVREAKNGLEALEIIESEEGDSFDLLITDQLMPIMIGTELIDGARKIFPKLPVILMSGHTESAWPENAPFQRTVQKPFRSETFKNLIQELMRETGTT